MDMNTKIKLFELPNEILIRSFLFIENLDYSKYKLINKKSYDIIKYIINRYNEKINIIKEKYNNNVKKLIKELFSMNDENAIIFAYNNIKNTKKHISYYAGYYGNKYLIDLLNLDDYVEIGTGAAKGGKIDLVKFAVENGYTKYSIIASYAYIHYHKHIIDYAKGKGANDYNIIVKGAVLNGDLDLVKDLIEKGADDYVTISILAAKKGYLHIVEYVINLGVVNHQDIAEIAAFKGHLHIIDYIAITNNIDFYRVISCAAYGGRLNVIKDFDNFGLIKDYTTIANLAARGGHLDVIKYIHDKQVHIDYDLIFKYALEGEYNCILKYIISKNHKKHRKFVIKAAKYKNLEIVKYIIDFNIKCCKCFHKVINIALYAAVYCGLSVVKYTIDQCIQNYRYFNNQVLIEDDDFIKFLLDLKIYINHDYINERILKQNILDFVKYTTISSSKSYKVVDKSLKHDHLNLIKYFINELGIDKYDYMYIVSKFCKDKNACKYIEQIINEHNNQ